MLSKSACIINFMVKIFVKSFVEISFHWGWLQNLYWQLPKARFFYAKQVNLKFKTISNSNVKFVKLKWKFFKIHLRYCQLLTERVASLYWWHNSKPKQSRLTGKTIFPNWNTTRATTFCCVFVPSLRSAERRLMASRPQSRAPSEDHPWIWKNLFRRFAPRHIRPKRRARHFWHASCHTACMAEDVPLAIMRKPIHLDVARAKRLNKMHSFPFFIPTSKLSFSSRIIYTNKNFLLDNCFWLDHLWYNRLFAWIFSDWNGIYGWFS